MVNRAIKIPIHPLRFMGWIAALTIMQACTQRSAVSSDESSALHFAGDTLTINAHAPLLSKIKCTAVVQQPHQLTFSTAAMVKIIPNSYVEIPMPFAGRVVRSYVSLGQKVAVNTALFSISSSDYFDAQRTYLEAKQTYALAANVLKRQKDLLSHGVGTQKELEEAETNFAISKTTLNNATASLKIYDNNPAQVVLGQPLLVRSPIHGEILSNTIVLGQYNKEDAPALLRIAELSKVWVSAYIKEKDLGAIDQIRSVEVRIDNQPSKRLQGKIVHINQFVDEANRNIEVLVECDNKDRLLKPGMYVNTQFEQGAAASIFIPAKAVLQFNDKSFVWVQLAPHTFMRRYVQTGVTENEQIQIIQGLSNGEQIIGEGAFYLLASN
ncbi:efflux RND transporter periplasmic adaptor subunit [Sphingobacterium sp. BIGb0165]|uniref:efflux RND transporter periplasmic adaptor subunit n=1 Tax=Sphingobacterium sp. BIGb0165 TaxID=2940615 RepID=UPI002167B306|nr:efflux RND transporter periplasmic adaptor subunit [Sphingobacterium sp. BIGb0165]MCS4227191.1 cobalt-zinc-cadmium efflux system membrane fusion protein [Sphingobacterium sp. BIGb0165]